MKRWLIAAGLAAGFILGAVSSASAQGTFKIPFLFQAGGKKLPAGDYVVGPKSAEQLALRRLPDGEEIALTVLKRLDRPKELLGEPQIIFHAVGNFEPSYTEYVTDYVLAELWLPGEDGYLVHVTKGAHTKQTLKGVKTVK
jgi:hypothetical protein